MNNYSPPSHFMLRYSNTNPAIQTLNVSIDLDPSISSAQKYKIECFVRYATKEMLKITFRFVLLSANSLQIYNTNISGTLIITALGKKRGFDLLQSILIPLSSNTLIVSKRKKSKNIFVSPRSLSLSLSLSLSCSLFLCLNILIYC